MTTIEICDICGKKCDNRLFFRTDRAMDAAGSMEDEGEVYDLCEIHENMVLKKVLFKGTNEIEKQNINKRLVMEVENLKKSKE